ncbi:hypothetical protein GCM10010492_49220 [Saccharothrix mutabilis subsp. mutabilis]|uniref:Uncharacterized protein n=1 Tax=Saccharothrix mutabilis subsp. mutabilis TaxID=66855 RepID=A0ABP3DWP5_9PSEU
MWDDDDLGTALRAELARQTPPTARGGLDDAVARGRRRRRRHRFGAALATMTAVAGVASVAVGVGALPSGGQDVGASGTSATGTSSTEAPWPRADLPTRPPHTTWTPAPTARPPAGWPTGPAPRCEVPDPTGRDLDSVRGDLADLQGRVRGLVAEVMGVSLDSRVTGMSVPRPSNSSGIVADVPSVDLLIERRRPATGSNTGTGFDYTVHVADTGGVGSLVLTFGRFTGDPLTAADEQAYDLGNCRPPKRHVLADGTVLQIYDVAPSDPFASLDQTLRIYLPDGRLHSVSVRNFSGWDFATNRQDPARPHRVGPGRPTLPLTEAQLAELGLALVG